MSDTLIAVLVIYTVVGFGAALGTAPRAMFTGRVERFLVRVSCGFMWPMLYGYLLARKVSESERR